MMNQRSRVVEEMHVRLKSSAVARNSYDAAMLCIYDTAVGSIYIVITIDRS